MLDLRFVERQWAIIIKWATSHTIHLLPAVSRDPMWTNYNCSNLFLDTNVLIMGLLTPLYDCMLSIYNIHHLAFGREGNYRVDFDEWYMGAVYIYSGIVIKVIMNVLLLWSSYLISADSVRIIVMLFFWYVWQQKHAW